jgi:UDP-N-acetylmuramyl pentapeptide phosphotransferase/UDP-N-acetylglucosamine-1-phosphate transferase
MWEAEFAAHLPQTLGSVFFVALAICGLVVSFRREIAHLFRGRDDLSATQAMHTTPTPRLGGLAILLGIVSTLALSGWTPLERHGTYVYLATLSPLFLAGFLEDLGFRVPPKIRLSASILAGLLTALGWGIWVQEVNIPGFDFLLGFPAFAITFSVIAAAGVTNAFNLIDGLNGLAGLFSLSAALALSIISAQLGLHTFQAIFWMVIMATAGFLIFNFPFGKLFLGDAGAYLLGHTLVWTSIALLKVSPEISPFAILLLFFWPIADTLLAIWRRAQSGQRADAPDRLHFHQLVMRYIEIKWFGRGRRKLVNQLATLIIVPFFAIPQVAGVLFMTDDLKAKISVLVFGALFVGTYVFGVRSAGHVQSRRLSTRR